jgi:peptidoglycan hydrolase-like protein with peptidoglycan-binding domain
MKLRTVIPALALALAVVLTGPAAIQALAEENTPAVAEVVPTMLMTRAAQELLNLLGYDVGPVDGLLGSRTRSAILAFQSDRAEAETGTIDRDLLDSLVAEIAERRAETVPLRPVVFYKAHLEHHAYSRLNKPIGAHTRAYFRFKNNSDVPVTGIEFAYAFKNPFGDTLYRDSDRLQIKIAPKAVTAKSHYYYWEDMALVADAYDKLAAAFRDGGARAEVTIKRVVFADGTEVAY